MTSTTQRLHHVGHWLNDSLSRFQWLGQWPDTQEETWHLCGVRAAYWLQANFTTPPLQWTQTKVRGRRSGLGQRSVVLRPVPSATTTWPPWTSYLRVSRRRCRHPATVFTENNSRPASLSILLDWSPPAVGVGAVITPRHCTLPPIRDGSSQRQGVVISPCITSKITSRNTFHNPANSLLTLPLFVFVLYFLPVCCGATRSLSLVFICCRVNWVVFVHSSPSHRQMYSIIYIVITGEELSVLYILRCRVASVNHQQP